MLISNFFNSLKEVSKQDFKLQLITAVTVNPYLSICLSVSLSVCGSVHLSVHLSIYLWLCSPLLDLGRFSVF
jgi:hypothetical protein